MNSLTLQTTQLLQQVEPDFRKMAEIHGAVHFEREALFALQLLQQNEYLANVAMNNPDSLKRAVLNVAAVGLTLSPVYKEAYLVPRKNKKAKGGAEVCLDPSARGLVKLATNSGAIEWAQSEVVCENDTFEFGAYGETLKHSYNPLESRGNYLGAFCIAKTPGGDFLKTFMRIDEIKRIAETYSEAFQKNVGPWKTEPEEMFKKTVTKRSAKQWPSKSNSAAATAYLRALEIDADTNPVAETPAALPPDVRSHSFDAIRAELVRIDREETAFLTHAQRMFNRKLETIEDLTDVEIAKAQTFLKSLPAKEAQKAKA